MAYADRQTAASRAVSIVTVATVHAAFGAALIYGFAPEIVDMVKPTRTTTFNVPPEPAEPPPSAERPDNHTSSVITAPQRPIELSPLRPTVPVPDITLPPFEVPKLITPPADINPPVAAIQPKSPAPANDMARWATASDYPGRALKAERQGTSHFRVVVGTNGRVKSCEITRSSGSEELDEATCKLVSRRARFEPATNELGEKAVGTFSSAIRWQLPE